MYDFDYVKPSSIRDAISALSTGDAQPISGGQTLIPTLKQRLARPAKLVDLLGIAEMSGVEATPDGVTVGAAVRHVEVERSSDVRRVFPALAAVAGGIGDPQVRNMGTIGGSVANNDPSACYPAACLGTGAAILTSDGEIAADDFFTGLFETALGEGQIVTGVRFPVPERANYQKFVQPASRFALVGVFVAKFASGVRVVVTGASENGVFRWSEAETALNARFNTDAVSGLALSAEGLIGDIHGTPEYRAHLVGVMAGRAVAAA